MNSRLEAVFARAADEGRGALSIYLPVGHPDPERSAAFFKAALAGGADFVEVGFPFSDPAADGPVIQDATAQALRNGVRVQDGLALGRQLRREAPQAGLVCMTYANIAYRLGWDGFAAALAENGFDACILPDVPLEESGPVREALAKHGIAWVPLVTPTTPPDRMAAIAATATGFLYVVANVGITGQSDPGPLVEATVERARAAGSRVPLVVGFGIASAGDVRRVLRAGADGAIVGSHVVHRITQGADPDAVRDLVADLREGTP